MESLEKEKTKEILNENLKEEILAMVEVDQEMRKSYEWNQEIDKRNTERMKEIINQYGWPGKSLIGKEAANQVWLLVQHADHDLEFQKEALRLLQEAVAKGEANKENEAFLIDRVRVNSGEPQVFGTQFYKDEEGRLGPRPIENPESLNDRRKKFNLGLFSNYERIMHRMNQKSEENKKKK